MLRVSDSPFPKGFELEISQQLDKIAETGNKFREQVSDLGAKLNFFRDAESHKIQELQVRSSSTTVDWMKPIENKLQEMTNAQHKMSADIRELEERRFNLQKLMAGKLEDLLKDVTTLKSLTEKTTALKPKLDEQRRVTEDLESQVEKMTQDLKGKLDLLESTIQSNQKAVKSSLDEFRVPVPTERSDPHGWIVIQKRQSGPLKDFERDWIEYENGFGSVDGNFWLGLKKIHELTADGSMELRVELTDWDGNCAHANYSKFSVGSATELYRLSINGYSGNAGDALKNDNGGQFSTMDKKTSGYVGAQNGGWWKQSNWTNLNGLYYENKEAEAKANISYSGVYWFAWKRSDYSLKKVLMKIRKRE